MRLSTTCDENSGGSPSASTRSFSSGSSEPMSTFTSVSITRSSPGPVSARIVSPFRTSPADCAATTATLIFSMRV